MPGPYQVPKPAAKRPLQMTTACIWTTSKKVPWLNSKPHITTTGSKSATTPRRSSRATLRSAPNPSRCRSKGLEEAACYRSRVKNRSLAISTGSVTTVLPIVSMFTRMLIRCLIT